MSHKEDETFHLKESVRGPAGLNKYKILKKLRRDPSRSQLLIAYYGTGPVPFKSEDGVKYKSGLVFIKTTTYYLNRATNSYGGELAENHARFWQMKRLMAVVGTLDGVPEVIKVGTFKPNRRDSLPVPVGMELDFIIWKFVGDVDLRTYVTASKSLYEEEEWLANNANRQLKDHYKGVPSNTWAEHIRKDWRCDSDTFPGLRPEKWYRLARALTKNLKRIHNRGFIHGALNVDSVRLTLNPDWDIDVTFVDFEESSLLAELLRQRPGSLEKAEETHDITGLGNILFFLASGQRWEAVREEVAKKKGQTDVTKMKLSKSDTQRVVNLHVFASKDGPVTTPADAFGRLNFEEEVLYRGIAKIIDKCLRESDTDQYLGCEDILEELDILGLDTTEINVDGIEASKGGIKSITATLEKLKALGANVLNKAYEKPGSLTLFHSIWSSRIQQLASSLAGLSRRHYEIHGDREELIDHLTRVLGGLVEGDVYLTLTHPGYWSQNNLGSNGRFLSMNQMVSVKRGVHTIRLFVLTNSQAATPATRDLLNIHQSFENTLRAKGVDFLLDAADLLNFVNRGQRFDAVAPLSVHRILEKLRTSDSGAQIYFTGVIKTDGDTPLPGLNTILTSSNHVALILSHKTRTCVSITFHDHPVDVPDEMDRSSPASRRIHKVRFALTPWTNFPSLPKQESIQDFVRAMDTNLRLSMSLATFNAQPISNASFSPSVPSLPIRFAGAQEVPSE